MNKSNKLLTTTGLAAVLAFAGTGIALAQAPGQQPAASQPGQAAPANQQRTQAAQQLQQAEQSLRQALQQMQAGSGQQQTQATQGVRQALTQLQQVMQQLPAEQRSAQGGQRLEREVGEAQASVQGDRPDQARARIQIEEVLVAIPVLRAELVAAPGAATGAQIVVREAAPTVDVQQGQPTVTVRQQAPVITVVVPQPEIIVRQAPPQVTVQMPEPQVSVVMPQPQVRVVENQQAPQVQVTPTQPRIQMQRAEPEVRMQQQGQPVIRYEQQGEAQVRVVPAAPTAATATPAPALAAGAQPAVPPPAAGLPLARVQSLVGTNVVGANGRDAGEVENLLIDRNGQVRAAVVEWGGFLGIGESRAVVPIEQLRFGAAGERVRMDLTREQLERLPRFDRNRLATYGVEQGWGDGVRLHR